MISEEMEKALYTLNRYLASRDVTYAITGTVALDILGLTPSNHSPNDIDILIIEADKESLKDLREQELISGLSHKDYPNSEGVSFIVNGIKVNAIYVSNITKKEMLGQCIEVAMGDLIAGTEHAVLVHKAGYAIGAKGELGRLKDYRYLRDLAVHILNTLK